MTEEEMNDATKDLDFKGSPTKVLVDAQTVLTKAIQKAIDGGWKPKSKPGVARFTGGNEEDYLVFTAPLYIFSHDFAQALWGEEPYHEYAEGETHQSNDGEKIEYDFQVEDTFAIVNWQYHIQQMVIAPDPIAYLGEHI